MDAEQRARRLTPGRKALIGGIIALMALLLLEGACRILLPTIRRATLPAAMVENHTQATGFVYDPDLFWYWRNLPSPASQINEYGFRRTQPMTPKAPAGVTRVVSLGDSQTLGAGVGPDQSYSAVAEARLGAGWEVLNAGISGYRSLNVYRLLQLRIGYFEPDAIVVDCSAGDSPRDDGPIVGSPLRSTTGRLLGLIWDSALFRTLELARGRLLAPEVIDGSAQRPDPGALREPGSHDLIAEWARDNGVALLFMAYPIWDDHTGEIRCLAPAKDLPPGYPVLPACDLLNGSGHPASALFQDTNHMTALGNQIIGEGLADLLSQTLGGE